VNRSLAFVGAVALVTAQPAITFAAHPGGFAPVRMAVPPPHIAVRGGSANQGGLRVPFEINVRPKPLPDALHFTLQSPTAYGLHPKISSLYRWYYWPSRTSYLWFPTLLAPPCYANSGFWGSPSDQQPSSFTIGSLDDGKANILSPQSFMSGFSTKDAGTTNTSPFTLQTGFSTSSCGLKFTAF
jgi:hypothetical protein